MREVYAKVHRPVCHGPTWLPGGHKLECDLARRHAFFAHPHTRAFLGRLGAGPGATSLSTGNFQLAPWRVFTSRPYSKTGVKALRG